MRRLSLGVVFLAVTCSVVTVLVVRAWAKDPPPAVKPKAAAKPIEDTDPFCEPPHGPRPYLPPTASLLRSTGEPPRAAAVPQTSAMEPPLRDRILTAEMAAAPEPQASIDVLNASETAAVARINAALASSTDIDFKETPLHAAVAQLQKRHKIEIQLDSAGLKDAGVEADCPVTKRVSGISLRSALRLVLDELQLQYVIHNEVLLITSRSKAESDEFMVTTIHPVKDLVLVRNEHDEIQTDFQQLIDLIMDAVEPKSWDVNGGNGTIASYQFRDHCLLVVMQTREVQGEIVDLLAALRRCGATDATSDSAPRLPKRPTIIAPTYNAVPGSPPSGSQGGGFF